MGTKRLDLLERLPGEDDLGWERRLDATADHAASLLLETCGRLGWGGGVASTDAQCRLIQVAKALGYPDWREATAKPKSNRKGIPPGVTRAVWDRDGWECQHCGTHRNLTVDHIVPISKGGTDDFDNLQTLCGPCNSSKGDRA